MQEKMKKKTKELLAQMKVKAEVDVKEEEGIFFIKIKSEDTGLLIGRHGETLHSLQLILGIIVNKENDEWQKIVVDVDDYRKQREKTLHRMAERAIQRAEDLGEEQELPSMPSFERRIIHMQVSEKEGVLSESKGSGRNRRVIVRLD